MAILELRLLGGYEGALRSGEPLELPTRKAWALLSFLALNPGRDISREQLAALLWGERSDEQARASLRQTLYEIRSALGPDLADCVIAKRDAVALASDEIEVDVLRLEELCHRGNGRDLAQIGLLCRGILLSGLETIDPSFDEWLTAERARLHDLASTALERLATVHLERGDSAAAIETARQLIRMDPLRERSHRLLMRGLMTDGRRSEALKHFRDLECLLETELSVTPDPETVQLRDELVRDGRPQTAASPEASADYSSNRELTKSSLSEHSGQKIPWHGVVAASIVVLAIAIGGLWVLHLGGLQLLPGDQRKANRSSVVRDTPTIAVLPFANLSDDPRRVSIADGLTEDLITALSKTSHLLVIARTSVAEYKDKPAEAQSIAKDLGVRYLLEGGLQSSGDNLRITAQLIDASSGHHLWSERYDRKAEQIFDLQDDIVRRVLVELQVELSDGEHAHVASRGTTNLDAWLLRLQAMTELYKFTRESTIRTRELLQAAHDLDPKWGRPLAGIAWSYWWEARRGWAEDRDTWIRRGIALAKRAIEMDPDDTLGYMQLGNLVQLQGDNERAVELREKAVKIAPNDFQANWGLGALLVRIGETDRGIAVLKHALKLSPRPPASLVWTLANAQLMSGRFENAIQTAERARALAPERKDPHVQLAVAYSAVGRPEEARAAIAEVLRIDPTFNTAVFRREHIDYKDQATVDKLAKLLTRTGLPE